MFYATTGSLFAASRAVSSAKIAIVVLIVVGKSAVYMKYIRGPIMLHRHIPD